MSSDSVRRSSRRAKKPLQYSAGDIVELSADHALGKGRLVSRLSEASSSNPRWLVAFDESWAEQNMNESSFGQIIGKAEVDVATTAEGAVVTVDDDHASNKNIKPKQKSTKELVHTKTPPPTIASPSSNGSPSSVISTTKTPAVSPSELVELKKVTFESSPADLAPSDTSLSSAAAKRVSAREERSRKRQAAIMEEVLLPMQQAPLKKKKMERRGNEPVIKVAMLTGTLYLYRGLHRRAEFVRKL